MSEPEQERKEKYHRVRSDFDELHTDEKVVFLLEATVSTLARGIDAFGRAVSDEINSAFSRRAGKKARAQENGETSTGEPAAGADASNAGTPDENPDEKSEETL